jgi:hypothetical protein
MHDKTVSLLGNRYVKLITINCYKHSLKLIYIYIYIHVYGNYIRNLNWFCSECKRSHRIWVYDLRILLLWEWKACLLKDGGNWGNSDGSGRKKANNETDIQRYLLIEHSSDHYGNHYIRLLTTALSLADCTAVVLRWMSRYEIVKQQSTGTVSDKSWTYKPSIFFLDSSVSIAARLRTGRQWTMGSVPR